MINFDKLIWNSTKKSLLTVLPSYYKVQIFWEGHTNLKKRFLLFSTLPSNIKNKWKFFQFFLPSDNTWTLPFYHLLKARAFLFSDRVFFTASISKSSISCLGWHFFALGRRKIIVIVKERRIKESDRVRNLNLGWPRFILQVVYYVDIESVSWIWIELFRTARKWKSH